ncbi:MAG: exodeoxyribonuclease VII small subunit [Oculatellaceae cyanobacterium Prado106]|jgi:exodeoxyribonuclease VII small subunit|nr:exodeoxyribonuclease VII small subunit [Oculatellaceae cyanobacterium Prado106]
MSKSLPPQPPLDSELDAEIDAAATPNESAQPKSQQDVTVNLPMNWNYEATVSQIEEIIDLIERGDLDLADVFDQFSTAVQQLRHCEAFLNRQQQQVDLLIETLLDEPDSQG